MGENTKVEWATHSFNAWIGCTKVSPACAHCYAEVNTATRTRGVKWGAGQARYRTAPDNWKKPLQWNKRAICANCGFAELLGSDDCRQCGVPFKNPTRPRVFCSSLSDWLDDDGVPTEWRVNLLETIHATPNLDWLLLSKRPENWERLVTEAFEFAMKNGDADNARQMSFTDWLGGWVHAHVAPANVWIGTTVENQQYANERLPELLKIPARVRFVSCEPLLGPVDLSIWMVSGYTEPPHDDVVSWVIAGGESGHHARPSHPNWFRALRDQCEKFGAAFFFKQWGEWTQRSLLTIDGAPFGGSADFAKLDPSCEKWPQVIRLGEHGKNTRICENCTPDMGEELSGRILRAGCSTDASGTRCLRRWGGA